MARHNREQARKGGTAWRVVFVIALVVLIGALLALGFIAFSYMQGQQKYDRIAATSNLDTDDIESQQLAELKLDWDALRAINPDVVGWVYVPNTNINYPIVQARDNDYYLTHDFELGQGLVVHYGAIFLDAENKSDFSDAANFIYGHHMNDNSMFSALATLADQGKFDSTRIVYVLTPKGNYRLRSFSLVHCAADDPLVQMEFSSAKEWNAYVRDKAERSVTSVSDAPDLDAIGKVFAFATCDNYATNGRWVLYCYVDDTSVAGQAGLSGKSSDSNVVDSKAAEDVAAAAGGRAS